MENGNLLKSLIDDFIMTIINLNNYFAQNNANSNNKINESTKISECLLYLNNRASENFMNLFKDTDLTINKLANAFEFYLILTFGIIKDQLKDFQIEANEKQENNLKNYLENKHNITKENLTNAIRLFISLFLSKEKDKENKIKKNYNNVAKYLNIPDLWYNKIYNNREKFNEELNEIKNLNFQINQTISFYELLDENIDEKYFTEIKEQIKRNEIINKLKRSEKLEEKEEKQQNNEKKEQDEKEERDNITNYPKFEEKEKEEKQEAEKQETEKPEDSDSDGDFDPNKYYQDSNNEDDDDDEDRD